MGAKIGIIGGSGLYDIELEDKKEIDISTPFGSPSDSFMTGKLKGKDVVFLARHSRGHRILPSELNYRANIYGLKKLAVDHIISISAVGSLKEELKPLDIMLPDQYVDRTNQARLMTFFGDGIVAHIAFGEPVCQRLRGILYKSAEELKITVHNQGTYLNMEGPAFSTKAESYLYRSWGMDVIGMTNLPEAKLAREAEICFAAIATITDYDCWHKSEEAVTVDMIIENLKKNTENTKMIITKAVSLISADENCACRHALENAIITPSEYISDETRKKLDVIIGKYLK